LVKVYFLNSSSGATLQGGVLELEVYKGKTTESTMKNKFFAMIIRGKGHFVKFHLL